MLLHLAFGFVGDLFEDDQLVRLFVLQHFALFEVWVVVVGFAHKLGQDGDPVGEVGLEERVFY